ncbi:kinetochore protein Ndc80 [Cochliomyia hominivorax]
MQRPRRTSEFQEDPGGIRRQSRAQQRNTLAPSPSGPNGMAAACTSGTAKKYSTRQSRIAIPSRPSSCDRAGGSINPYLSVPPSTTQRGTTPQKTPLPKSTANRVLFTAEKQRNGQSGNGGPLHNDKKWIQEQTQRITEHLLRQNTLGGGISTDFLNRGLRQMSIKQFVAIINYFLGYIWGNRYTVGNNHVEDIVNILQKLQYPHAVNKSWLKTPNTQHSFGNVIVLFDFLMDFVPPEENENNPDMHFEISEPEELSASKMNLEHFQIPDLEFQQELLKNSEEGFMLWDKQKKEEFDSLKLHTCNLLIQKKCGVADLDAIEMEIQKSEKELKNLQQERPPEDKEAVKMKSKLTNDLKSIKREIKTLQEECENNERDIKELNTRKMLKLKEVETLEIDIKSLQNMLNKQTCTVEQRDQMMTDVMQHKQMVAIKERAIQDLQSRYHKQQIEQSKAIKLFNDQIETFNAHMREIKFSDLLKSNPFLNDTNLELSLRPQEPEVEKLIPILHKINEKALNTNENNEKKLLHIQEHCKQLTDDIDSKLRNELNTLRTANNTNADILQKIVNSLKKDECKLLADIQKLEEDIIADDKTMEELKKLIEQKKSLVEELIQANEQTMKHAEEKHCQWLKQKKEFLNAYEEVLDECMQNDVLQQLNQQIQLQEKQLEEFRKEFGC